MSKKNIFANMAANLGSYADQVAAIIKGDDAAALAAKVELQARAALNSAISTVQGELHDLNEAVTDATETLRRAILNDGKELKGADARQAFLRQLNTSRTELLKAEKALETKKEELGFYEDSLAFLNGKGQKGL